MKEKTEEQKAAWREYNKLRQRDYRKKNRVKTLVDRGQCPVCGILLKYEKEHASWYPRPCPWYFANVLMKGTMADLFKGTYANIHAKGEFYSQTVIIMG